MPKSMDIDEGRAMARGLRAHVDRKKVVEARTALDAGEDATAIEREAGNRCERATGRVECDGERSCADDALVACLCEVFRCRWNIPPSARRRPAGQHAGDSRGRSGHRQRHNANAEALLGGPPTQSLTPTRVSAIPPSIDTGSVSGSPGSRCQLLSVPFAPLRTVTLSCIVFPSSVASTR
jgi:hypothetical protein